MSFTSVIGGIGSRILGGLVRLLAITHIHPNVFTCLGLAINAAAAWMFAQGEFAKAGIVVLLAAVFDLVDGPIARRLNEQQIKDIAAYLASTTTAEGRP